MNQQKIPVTVLTGFLGAGKTTLLNRILTEHHGNRIAVIENEFGEIGIDNELVIQSDEEIFEMNNGCICCTVRGDLIRILNRLMSRRDRFDYVLIETTGLADPGPVAQTFFMDDEIKEQFRLDSIITVVDVAHVEQHIDDSTECQEQIAFADVLLLNKMDLLSSDKKRLSLESKIRSMNSVARIYRTQNADIDIQHVLNVRAFDLHSKLKVDPDFLREELPFEWCGVYSLQAGQHNLQCRRGPDPSMDIVLLPLCCDQSSDIDQAKYQAMRLFSSTGQHRASGEVLSPSDTLYSLELNESQHAFTLNIEQAGWYALFTQHLPEEFDMQLYREGDVLRASQQQQFAAPHEHDESVTSVGLSAQGDLDASRFENWVTQLLRTKGVDIFRMKGIVSLAGEANRFVFQGVHMLFDGEPDKPWNDDEPRNSQLVLIGRDLDRHELQQGFDACMA